MTLSCKLCKKLTVGANKSKCWPWVYTQLPPKIHVSIIDNLKGGNRKELMEHALLSKSSNHKKLNIWSKCQQNKPSDPKQFWFFINWTSDHRSTTILPELNFFLKKEKTILWNIDWIPNSGLLGEKCHSVELHCEWLQNLSHYQTLQNEHPQQRTEKSRHQRMHVNPFWGWEQTQFFK